MGEREDKIWNIIWRDILQEDPDSFTPEFKIKVSDAIKNIVEIVQKSN